MLNICSLFQRFFGFIKSISKKTYRDSMVITAGILLVAIISLYANDFGGSGKNNTNVNQDKGENEVLTDENDTDANALVQSLLFSCVNTDDENNSLNLYYKIANFISGTEENLFFDTQSVSSIEPLSADTVALSQETVNETEEQTEVEVVNETEPVIEPDTEEVTEQATEQETELQTEAEETYEYTCVDFDISEDDYYWLTKIVEAEAGDQDEIGRILVTNVIINRVRSGRFPNNITSVIFQNNGRTYQFEPVKNERIYDACPSETTIACVDRALNGEDYSDGALFFTMKTSSYSWFNTELTFLFVHGDHYFYTY